MRLLVSVASAADAVAALAGGADLIDAKDPLAGALGPVTEDELRAIHDAVGRRRPVTAALGDAADEEATEHAARAAAAIGVAFVKIGFAGITSGERVTALTAAAVRGARDGHPACTVVAVTYADGGPACLAMSELRRAAASGGARGLLLDTADKAGAGVRGYLDTASLATWIAQAHEVGLFAAVAGKLTLEDLPIVRACHADIAGVRGAACCGGRSGPVEVTRVQALRQASRRRNASTVQAPAHSA
jgi:uncharacterized protein (UPF0264 family)